MKQFIIGSQAFFQGIEGFQSKDIDRLQFVDNPIGYNTYKQISTGSSCLFLYATKPLEQMLEDCRQAKAPMCVGKFLVKEVAEHLGLTIEQLKTLKPVIDRLDEKHFYEKVIYDAYIANDTFTLTEEQRLEAFAEYKKARPSKEQSHPIELNIE